MHMKKTKILFVINQFFKGGAEVALLNLFHNLPIEQYQIDLLIFDQIDLKNTISLIPNIPSNIHVFDAAAEEGKIAFVKKALFKIVRKITKRQPFRQTVYSYLKDKEYDVAISYGEWFSSSLVALYTTAKRKYVWIHADMEKASFLHPDIVRYQRCFDKFIFVSELSRRGAEKQYSFLKNRSCVVHNIVNADLIQRKSLGPIKMPNDGLPVLITVANIRPEKNHLRQVEVMELLFEQGLQFHWLNMGSLADTELVKQVQNVVEEAGLTQYFKLLGAKKNPYTYMAHADAVCVLSDHESWSMVITEAKALGVPVIATKTSGALEQLVHEETGLLCDFSVQSIADTIRSFFSSKQLQSNIRKNLGQCDIQKQTLQQLEPLFRNLNKKILYIFDDINYVSGARNAALAQIDILLNKAEVTLFSAEPCKDELLNEKYQIVDLSSNLSFRCLSVPFKIVLQDRAYSVKLKVLRFFYALSARVQLDDKIYEMLLKSDVTSLFNSFDTVCVVSEASKFRALVATLQHPKKIQWIHTDYVAWQQQSSWTRTITKKDDSLYAQYDSIILLSNKIKERFDHRYPNLQSKTVAIPNFIRWEEIVAKAQEPTEIFVDKNKYNLITIGRLEQEKRHDRLLLIANELRNADVNFHWYFVGDGRLRKAIESQCQKLELESYVTLTGNLENPYPLFKQCDLFVLLSDYEGTPVTIDEAKVLGVPVLANDIGGISDQLEDGKYGQLIEATNIKNLQKILEQIKVCRRYDKRVFIWKNKEIEKAIQELLCKDDFR